MKKNIQIFSLFVFLLFSSIQVFSQDTIGVEKALAGNLECYSGDCSRPDYHAPIGVMIDHTHTKKEWMVSYRYMSMVMKDNLQGSNKISNEQIYEQYLMSTERMSMQMHMLMLMYGISDRITLMGMTNFLVNKMDMSMIMSDKEEGHDHHHRSDSHSHGDEAIMHNSGFGDTKAYVLYSLIKKSSNELLISSGINIPTGSVSRRGTSLTGGIQKYTYSMQQGTGSWAVLPGITYTRQAKLFSFGVQVVSDIKLNRNKAGYRRGNEFTTNAWIAKSWNTWLSNSLRLNTSNIAKSKGFDQELAPLRTTEPDADISNSGSFLTALNLGLNLALPGKCKGHLFAAEFGMPLYQYVNGIQPKTQYLLNAGWQYNFR